MTVLMSFHSVMCAHSMSYEQIFRRSFVRSFAGLFFVRQTICFLNGNITAIQFGADVIKVNSSELFCYECLQLNPKLVTMCSEFMMSS